MLEHRYNTFWLRIWAGWIDCLILLPLWIAHSQVFNHGFPIPIIVASYLFNSFAGVLYSILLHFKYGQTVGKRVMKIKVKGIDAESLTLLQAATRDVVPILATPMFMIPELPYILKGIDPGVLYEGGNEPTYYRIRESLICAWFLLELITMLSNRRRRAIHDYVARTVVERQGI